MPPVFNMHTEVWTKMTDERMLTFLHSFDSEKPAYLGELERYSKENNVPIIRPQMQNLLRLLVTWGRPMRILEVGTAVGFSALFMSEYARGLSDHDNRKV